MAHEHGRFARAARRRRTRGLSLLTVMIAVAVLTFLVIAAVAFTGKELAGAARFKRHEVTAACVNGARNYVLSRLQMGAAGRQWNPQIDGGMQVGELQILTGHMDEPDGGLALTRCAKSVDPGSGVMDLTNITLVEDSRSRTCWTGVAHCIHTGTGDRLEVEFQVSIY